MAGLIIRWAINPGPNTIRLARSSPLSTQPGPRRDSATIGPDDGRTTYQYDGAGKVVAVTSPFGEKTTFSYDPQGREARRVMANGVAIECAYDTAGRKTLQRQINATGEILSAFSVSYDRAGRPITIREHDGSELRYTYDPSGQVAREKRTGVAPYDVWYAYDALGNRLRKKEPDGITSYTYNAAHALVSMRQPAGAVTKLSYDANGNLVLREDSGESIIYEWDDGLISVNHPVHGKETYSYDGIGLRTQAITPASTRRFVRDGANIIAETNADGAVQASYTHASDAWGGLISQRREDRSDFYCFDLSSNIRTMADASGRVVASYVSDSFGRQIGGSNDANPWRFGGNGGYYSDNPDGLVYVRARWYDPMIGRWISKDPIGTRTDGTDQYATTAAGVQLARVRRNHLHNPSDTDGLALQGTHIWSMVLGIQGDPTDIWDSRADQNKYRYVGNSPNRVIDPTGYGWLITQFFCCTLHICSCITSPPEIPKGSSNACAACQTLCTTLLGLDGPDGLVSAIVFDQMSNMGCQAWCANLTNFREFNSCTTVCYNAGIHSGSPQNTCEQCCYKLCPSGQELTTCLNNNGHTTGCNNLPD